MERVFEGSKEGLEGFSRKFMVLGVIDMAHSQDHSGGWGWAGG